MKVYGSKGWEVAERRAQEMRKAELAFWEAEAEKWRDAVEKIHRHASLGQRVDIEIDRDVVSVVKVDDAKDVDDFMDQLRSTS